MSKKIRIGVLSFAHYHARFWSETFRDSPIADFIGIWDEEEGRGQEAAKTYGTRYWSELSALLQACDAVAICSETVHHLRLIREATAQKCHILCEKPLATTLADCDSIESLVQRAGVTFMQSFPKRFDPVNHELKKIIEAGRLGTLALVRVRHGHFHGLEPNFHKEWFVQPSLGGGGTLIDEGVHAADFLRWMFGEPESVVAMKSAATLKLPVEDAAIAVFRFPNGMLAEVCASWSFAAANDSIEVYGTKGTVLISGVDLGSRDITSGGYLKIYEASSGEKRWTVSDVVPRFKTGGFHQQNALHFLAALHERKPPPITIKDGRRALELILAAYRSIESGCEQWIPR
jgi:myo-inositol 2-dehydrogenase / D-chiro-inositol 1-dehydrogenase